MTAPSDLRPSPEPATPTEIHRAMQPTPELGRFLYTAAGGNWYWIDRLLWNYDEWLARLSHPRVETWVMYEAGTPAAYFELDGTAGGDVEIAYLGVVPAFMGRGLGRSSPRRSAGRGRWELVACGCTRALSTHPTRWRTIVLAGCGSSRSTSRLPSFRTRRPARGLARACTARTRRCCGQAVEERNRCRKLKTV